MLIFRRRLARGDHRQPIADHDVAAPTPTRLGSGHHLRRQMRRLRPGQYSFTSQTKSGLNFCWIEASRRLRRLCALIHGAHNVATKFSGQRVAAIFGMALEEQSKMLVVLDRTNGGCLASTAATQRFVPPRSIVTGIGSLRS